MADQNVKTENAHGENKPQTEREHNNGVGQQRNGSQGHRNGGRNSHGGHRGNHNHRSRNHYDRERNESAKTGKESIAQREGGRNIADGPVKRSIQAQNVQNTGDAVTASSNNEGASGQSQRNFSKPQKNFQRDANRNRHQNHIKVDETREDIIRDIGRIEKEIELEIKEISALKFGM